MASRAPRYNNNNNNAFLNALWSSLFTPSKLRSGGKMMKEKGRGDGVSPESILTTHALASLATMILGIILIHYGIIWGERNIQGLLLGSGFPWNWQTGIEFVIIFAILSGLHALILWAVSTDLGGGQMRAGTGLVLYAVLAVMSIMLLSWLGIIASPFDVMPFLVLVPLLVSGGFPFLLALAGVLLFARGEWNEKIEESTALSFTPIAVIMPAFIALVSYSILMDRPGGFTVFICAGCILVKFFASAITAPALAISSLWMLIIQSRLLEGTGVVRNKVLAVQALILAATCIMVFLLTRTLFI